MQSTCVQQKCVGQMSTDKETVASEVEIKWVKTSNEGQLIGENQVTEKWRQENLRMDWCAHSLWKLSQQSVKKTFVVKGSLAQLHSAEWPSSGLVWLHCEHWSLDTKSSTVEGIFCVPERSPRLKFVSLAGWDSHPSPVTFPLPILCFIHNQLLWWHQMLLNFWCLGSSVHNATTPILMMAIQHNPSTTNVFFADQLDNFHNE